jgi:hypothetical protein
MMRKLLSICWILWQWPKGIYLHTKLVVMALLAVVVS